MHQESEEDLCYQAMVREIRDVLNQARTQEGLEPFNVDLLLEKPASEYAVYTVQNDPAPTYLESMINKVKEKEEYYPVVLCQRFEEDMIVKTDSLCEQAHEIAELILECDEEKEVCMDPKVNSLAVGISYSDEVLAVTLLLTKKIMAIKNISAPATGGIQVVGKMLTNNYGVYAARIIYEDKDKDPILVGPGYIEWNPDTLEFIINFEVNEVLDKPKKLFEFYAKSDVDTIPYMRKTNREKIRINQLYNALKFPCVEFPKENLTDEDKQRQRINAQIRLKRMKEEEERRNKEEERKRNRENRMKELQMAEAEAEKSDKDESSKGSRDDDDDASKDYSDYTHQDQTVNETFASPVREQQQKQISNKEIREELEIAIEEATAEVHKQVQLNEDLQERILALKKESNMMADKQSDITMSDIKYANTLAHVHQIRLDLKQTQDRYNKMASDLQVKLEEKTAKCKEIRQTFMELKREVSRKAAFSKTDKPIGEKKITEWEELEYAKSQDVRLFFLTNS